jgi:hypothetical protein
MGVNKIRLKIDDKDKNLIIPLQTSFDETGRGDLINEYEHEQVAKLVNITKDFEATQYRHAACEDALGPPGAFSIGCEDPSPNIFYNFVFADKTTSPTTWIPNIPGYPGGTPVPVPNNLNPMSTGMNGVAPCVPEDYTNWPIYQDVQYGYDFMGFTPQEIYMSNKDFVKSFFKLDFYDSVNRDTQKLYISIILNPVNGTKFGRPTFDLSCDGGLDGIFNCFPNAERHIQVPKFELDMLDNNDGYFIYWLKENTFLNLNTFYMSCKFYNARTGKTHRMINTPPAALYNEYNFDREKRLYYRVELNQATYTYTVYDVNTNLRVGLDLTNEIMFYEYDNI